MLTSALVSAGSLPLAHNAEHSPTSIIGRAGASPPSRTAGAIFVLAPYRNSLRASFYALFQFFLHGHCIYTARMHSFDRTWASQLRQSLLTQTSTAHGDPSLAAPMLITRFTLAGTGARVQATTVYCTRYAGALTQVGSLPLAHNA